MRKYVALAVSFCPVNSLRVALYRLLLGARIAGSARLGLGTVLATRTAIIGDAQIGRNNRFIGPFALTISDGVVIGNSNEFRSSGADTSAFCLLGRGVQIEDRHFLDATGGITICDFTRVAGRGTQFWTHGGQRETPAIVVGERCYIGSAARISQGVTLAENTYVGLGSVVVGSITEPGSLVLGNPGRVVKTGITARLSMVEQAREPQA